MKKNNSLLELDKYFKELENRESSERETKIRNDIEEQFFKLINVPMDGIDQFEEKRMLKKRMFVKKHLITLID